MRVAVDITSGVKNQNLSGKDSLQDFNEMRIVILNNSSAC